MKKIILISIFLLFSNTAFASKGDEITTSYVLWDIIGVAAKVDEIITTHVLGDIIGVAAEGDEIITHHVIGDIVTIPVTCYDEKLIVTVIENIRLVAWWVGRPPDAPSYTKIDGYAQRNNTIDFLHEILSECVFFNARFNTVLVRYISGPHRIGVTIFVHIWEVNSVNVRPMYAAIVE